MDDGRTADREMQVLLKLYGRGLLQEKAVEYFGRKIKYQVRIDHIEGALSPGGCGEEMLQPQAYEQKIAKQDKSNQRQEESPDESSSQ